MRTIKAGAVTEAVKKLCIEANCDLPADVREAIRRCRQDETFPIARSVLEKIEENYLIAAAEGVPICQDTGLACVFLRLGQEVHIEGDLRAAVDEGVRAGYRDGYLRKSCVADPLRRVNTGDNTPAVIHWKIVPGNAIDITITPKGMGSENMSRIFMLKPADGADGVVRSVVETVREAGSNPCPPIVIGVGIGGNFETAPLAAKEALLVPCGVRNPIEYYAKLEEEILREVNKLGIGPSGCGGTVTALDAHIVTKPTHIAGMPVAVNICCHALRHAHGRIEGRG